MTLNESLTLLLLKFGNNLLTRYFPLKEWFTVVGGSNEKPNFPVFFSTSKLHRIPLFVPTFSIRHQFMIVNITKNKKLVHVCQPVTPPPLSFPDDS